MNQPLPAQRHGGQPERIPITQKERKLKENHAGRPNRRPSAKTRQHFLSRNQLNLKKQEGGKKSRNFD